MSKRRERFIYLGVGWLCWGWGCSVVSNLEMPGHCWAELGVGCSEGMVCVQLTPGEMGYCERVAEGGAEGDTKATEEAGSQETTNNNETNNNETPELPSPPRLACSLQIDDMPGNAAVKTPLVLAKNHLVFGAGNNLYAIDTSCPPEAGVTSLHTGALQGPMVALGGSGRIAVALGGGGPAGRNTPRLSLVDMTGEGNGAPAFVYNSNNDCSPKNTTFNQGLSLASIITNANGTETDWRFAAPANGTSTTTPTHRLLIYRPNGNSSSSRCTYSPNVSSAFMAPVVQNDNHYLLGIHEDLMVRGWSYGNRGIAAVNVTDKNGNAINSSATNPSIAVVDGGVWVSGLYKNEEGTLTQISPAAVDEEGRVYMVRCDTNSQNSKCQLLYSESEAGKTSIVSVELPADTGAPVGSPILGQPAAGKAAEMYVVTTQGWVLAYKAETLEVLWEEQLPALSVESTAQPVLTPHDDNTGTLWVIGSRGEIRGLRVDSLGLSQSAQWPKAFHDNCNTSSTVVRPSNVSTCF